MALRMMDEGAERILDCIYGAYNSTLIEPTIMLYTNVVDLTDTNAVAADAFDLLSFTQAQYGASNFGTGIYETQQVLPAVSIDQVSVGATGNIWEASWGPITFTFSAALDAAAPSVRGFIVFDNAAPNEVVFFAENLASLYTPTTLGDELIITPRFRLGNGTPI
jgi:hypothetical protein